MHHVTRRGAPLLFAPSNTAREKKKKSHTMCMELRWDSGTEVVIRAAAKHGVNNLADGSLNRRGNRRSRAETKGPVGAGAGTSFLAPWQFGASARETNGVQRSRCCQSVMTGFSPPGSIARDSQRLSCPIRNDGQRATPTARPTCWEDC